MDKTMTPFPELDRGALGVADLAFVETPGTLASKTKAAIRAYLWALENTSEHPLGTMYPSLNDWREVAGQDVIQPYPCGGCGGDHDMEDHRR